MQSTVNARNPHLFVCVCVCTHAPRSMLAAYPPGKGCAGSKPKGRANLDKGGRVLRPSKKARKQNLRVGVQQQDAAIFWLSRKRHAQPRREPRAQHKLQGNLASFSLLALPPRSPLLCCSAPAVISPYLAPAGCRRTSCLHSSLALPIFPHSILFLAVRHLPHPRSVQPALEGSKRTAHPAHA